MAPSNRIFTKTTIKNPENHKFSLFFFTLHQLSPDYLVKVSKYGLVVPPFTAFEPQIFFHDI